MDIIDTNVVISIKGGKRIEKILDISWIILDIQRKYELKGDQNMIKFITANKAPKLKYEKQMEQFLMNTVALTVGLANKDYSSFDPEVRKLARQDPDGMQKDVDYCQTLTLLALLDSGGYKTREHAEADLSRLMALYNKGAHKPFTNSEQTLFLNVHDKILALLLTSDDLINWLLKQLS